MTPRLKELYLKEIQPALKTEFGFKNLNMGPKIEKIILKGLKLSSVIIEFLLASPFSRTKRNILINLFRKN